MRAIDVVDVILAVAVVVVIVAYVRERRTARRRLERACWHLSAEDLVFAAWRLRRGEVLDIAEWLEERADDMAALGIVDGAFE